MGADRSGFSWGSDAGNIQAETVDSSQNAPVVTSEWNTHPESFQKVFIIENLFCVERRAVFVGI